MVEENIKELVIFMHIFKIYITKSSFYEYIKTIKVLIIIRRLRLCLRNCKLACIEYATGQKMVLEHMVYADEVYTFVGKGFFNIGRIKYATY